MNVYTPWREQLGDGLKHLQETLRPGLEEADHVRAYSSWLVPGMLQTRGYIETIFASIKEERALSDEDVRGAVDSRLGRQQLVTAEGKLYEFLIEESSFRNGIGGPGVMQEQLMYLAGLITEGDVSIGVLPMGVDRLRWPEASFWIFDRGCVSIELVSGSVDLEHPADVAEYEARFSQLAAEAVYGVAGFRLVLAAVESLGLVA